MPLNVETFPRSYQLLISLPQDRLRPDGSPEVPHTRLELIGFLKNIYGQWFFSSDSNDEIRQGQMREMELLNNKTGGGEGGEGGEGAEDGGDR